MSRIAIIGAGAWGTALAIVAGRKSSHQVRLWAYEREVRDSIGDRGENSLFLTGHRIPDSVSVTGDFAEALSGAKIVVSAVPSQHCRRIVEQMAPHLTSEMFLISAAKGLEQATLLRMTEVIGQITANQYKVGALSGPTFAAEVARGDPTAITIASEDDALMTAVQRDFSDLAFRVYSNGDVVGVELGGALKNIIAIAAGVCDGLGLGHNSVAALITRGLAEITRLASACGGRAETMSGLAGLGDLVLTCTGALSRNRSVGVELGRGRMLPEIVAGMHGMVAEGVFTTDAAVQLARAHKVEMPITQQIHAILNEGKSPRHAIHELMTRSSKSEAHAGAGPQSVS
ncbi:MAG TPA: NAD(P)H-dependent glycerol-3-phosphate dehydrogenase [Terriglobales bacterium]|jgi:glycerol-3-phosphate dehydrogenase (NAD(P)+)|nr:NAD(P)H-dependent glycerol-3-phosphate dehydrogenase [Terriglobales bacterium]